MAENMRRAGIVGGGIGGLTAAIALRAAGWEVAVYERATEFTEVGAGVMLTSNALAALDLIGVGKPIRAHAIADHTGGVRSRRGRELMLGRVSDVFGGDDVVVVHRAELIAVLVDALPSQCLRPGSRVIRVDASGDIETAEGTTQFDLVVAADGIHSLIRRQVWPEAGAVRHSGITGWRWIVDAPPPEWVGMVVGYRAEFTIMPMAGNRISNYAGTHPSVDSLDHFKDWPEPVPAMVAAADPQRVLENELLEIRVPKSLARGRVALIGDAAHGMHPTLGQGAAMTIEDAVTLAAYAPDLAAYSKARRRRVALIGWLSGRATLVTEPTSRFVAAARDAAVALVPHRLALRAGKLGAKLLITRWRPPTIADRKSPRARAAVALAAAVAAIRHFPL
ncbi:FAD-dependent monooxygenase [Nocardia sp. NEAU-G5]|uniref:FAD-dependent monooxygenase n=1 Tax=Nocardia albiluteola TaxID=2842303 RepID=A0ABS6B559_9NOCA|nr:FAD-dependent monooxygenase [Nocardia albiluteola]MBU3065448.1 FAD-dependent monooxygenase [Nocardia albiluteola]